MVSLAMVAPWLGTREVSPSTTTTRAKDTSSSSATIWPSAVRMPVPRSTWPLKAVTVPSCVIVMNVSMSPPYAAGRMTDNDPGARESGSMGRSGMAVGCNRLARGAQHGAHDFDMGAAAAEIVAQRFEDLLLGRMRVAQQQRLR